MNISIRRAARTLAMVAAAVLSAIVGTAQAAPAKPRKVAAPVRPPIWNTVSERKQLKAERAAEADAYRALAERIYGFRIEGGTLVWDLACQSDELRSGVRALIKGAKRTEEAEYTEDGIVQVSLGVTLRTLIETIETTLTKDKFTYSRELVAEDTLIEALGNGAVPGTKAQKMVCAKRAAEIDAQRLMAEKVMGVQVRGETTVRDFCLQNDEIRACVNAWLRGLKPVDIRYVSNGNCEVDVELTRRTVIETVETLIERRKGFFRTTTEVTQTTQTEIKDEVFKVTGKGTEAADIAVVGTVDAAIEAAELGDVLRVRTVETKRTELGPVVKP
jgi:hypothetical protein